MECGHCIAICPTNAAYLDNYDMSEVVAGSLFQTALDADALLRAIKGRRSVRQYTKQPVEQTKIHNILEAARFTPTAGNRQALSYAVVEKDLPKLKTLAMDSLLELGKNDLAAQSIPPITKLYAKRFLEMHKKYHESNGEIDLLFFNAPVVIVAMGDRPVDAGMAASNMELMAFAQGLGALFVGFTVRAASNSQAVRDFLGVPEGQQVLFSMGVGYPNVDYQRSVPRKKLNVNYL
jgi:nitroreductase